ncbi:hypothetical protein X732_23410 [Mesorhizobium sp. L2C066B000]|nr:hypothetical protein X732_23410 [Mesorhizobium sp. L2C066B000]
MDLAMTLVLRGAVESVANTASALRDAATFKRWSMQEL